MTQIESDAIHEFAAKKLVVQIHWNIECECWAFEIPFHPGKDAPFLPLTSWDLMGQGMAVLGKDESISHINITTKLLHYVQIYTDVDIEGKGDNGLEEYCDNIESIPTAFWQCWMGVEGIGRKVKP